MNDLEREMARLDALYRPVARKPFESGARVEADLAALGIAGGSRALLHRIIEAYTGGDATVRAALRELFERHPSFRWAAHLPGDWTSADELREHLVLLCIRDQYPDARDELLLLRGLRERARALGIDAGPILAGVAGLATDTDRFGMGSVRSWLRG
ncbi:hypothetical protein [Dactylosporangium sp. CA-233914]|uniref:hypothetical protein n=1 Tax=Dactylosporangium sp. CA-233914 TaxID=3239934 RepID=UPI003D8B62A2